MGPVNNHSLLASALELLVDIGDFERTVIVANSPMTRSLGLSGMEKLTDVDGMLFVYDRDEFVPFTAERTLIPLILAFYNKDGDLLEHVLLQPGDRGPFWPPQSFRYAVEMPPELFVSGKLRVKNPRRSKRASKVWS